MCCVDKAPKRAAFNNFDRFVFGSLYRLAPDVLNALVIVKPETVWTCFQDQDAVVAETVAE
jgi:hypothetical protein